MKIVSGIASTTHLDRQNHKMTKECLEDMAHQINSHYIPLDVEHQGIFIGVNLCGKVLPMEDGEWALHFVAGIFDDDAEKQSFKYGSPNTSFHNYLPMITVNDKIRFQIETDATSKEEIMGELKNKGLDAHEYVRKSADTAAALMVDLTIAQTGLTAIQTALAIYQVILAYKTKKPTITIKAKIVNWTKGESREIEVKTDARLDQIESVIRDFLER